MPQLFSTLRWNTQNKGPICFSQTSHDGTENSWIKSSSLVFFNTWFRATGVPSAVRRWRLITVVTLYSRHLTSEKKMKEHFAQLWNTEHIDRSQINLSMCFWLLLYTSTVGSLVDRKGIMLNTFYRILCKPQLLSKS